jgi:tetratricopeptide (TPR) repeat protein
MLARCYSDQKDYAKARAELERLSQNLELDLNDRRRLATATLFTGDTTEAIAMYKSLVEEAPDKQCGVMKLVGQMLVGMKQYDEALWFLNKRLEVDACDDPESDAQTYYFQGLSYLFTDKYAEAELALNKALELEPSNLTARLYLADAYFNLGKEAEALASYESIIEEGKKDPTDRNKSMMSSTYGKLAQYHQKAKDFPKLNTISKEWTGVAPDSEFAWIFLGISEHGTGNVPAACKAYKKAIEINPNSKIAKQQAGALGCE